MKAIMASTGGRAPPGQNKRKPCAGSRLLAAVPGSPARAPSTGPAPRSSCRPEAPRRVRADAATSAGFPRCSRSWPRSSRSPSTAKRARPGARSPFARLAPSPQASSSSLSSWFPWLHPLRRGSLRETRGGSDRQIARSLSLARSTVALTLERATAAGLRWPLSATLSDRVLEAMLYAGHGSRQRERRKAEPDWAHVHHELRRPGVTLMLLWEEYRQCEPDGYRYSRWCELYRAWEGRLSPTMRQAHPAGERMFVDYAGQTVDVVDPGTGE